MRLLECCTIGRVLLPAAGIVMAREQADEATTRSVPAAGVQTAGVPLHRYCEAMIHHVGR